MGIIQYSILTSIKHSKPTMKYLIVAAIFAHALAEEAYPKAAYKSEEYAARPYSFDYAVKDDASYNDFGHQESSDGKVVSGSYRVLLPDGRVQTVTYTVDDYAGYVADVKYEGEAKYPEYKPAYTPAAPAYPQ